jgi:hypothetical protein
MGAFTADIAILTSVPNLQPEGSEVSFLQCRCVMATQAASKHRVVIFYLIIVFESPA